MRGSSHAVRRRLVARPDIRLAGLQRRGIQNAVVVDLSRPDVGISVVKVVVPGLRLPDESEEPT